MSARNHEVTVPQELLDKDGNIAEPGWSKQIIQSYHRDAIKASKLRIKEWDYYLVLSREFGAAFTISDNGYMGLQSVSFLDFTKPFEHTESIINPFPMGKLNLPPSSKSGDITYEDKRLKMKFLVKEGERRIVCTFHRFDIYNIY